MVILIRKMPALLLIAILLVTTATAYSGITISGSSTVMPLVESCAEVFNIQQRTYHASVSIGGTGAGITNIALGRSDIAMASRELTDSERARYGESFKEHLIGYDGLCLAVSREIYDEGVRGLTREQVRKIYSGEISSWREVGGPNREIYVLAREQGSGTRDSFNEVIMGSRSADTRGVDEHGSVETGNAGVKTAIVGSRQAIGYLGYSYVNDSSIGIVTLDGVRPTIESIRSGEYPIARELYLYTFGEPKPGAKVFINFVVSPKGQAIAQEMGFIPLSQPGRLDSYTAGAKAKRGEDGSENWLIFPFFPYGIGREDGIQDFFRRYLA